jgi:hypothetical protein
VLPCLNPTNVNVSFGRSSGFDWTGEWILLESRSSRQLELVLVFFFNAELMMDACVSFIDDFTHFSGIFLMKFKADVLVKFRKNRTLVEKARTRLNVMWFIEKPDELKMRILECWLLDSGRNWIQEARDSWDIFLKGHRLWDIQKRKLIVSRDVVFNESMMDLDICEFFEDSGSIEEPVVEETMAERRE